MTVIRKYYSHQGGVKGIRKVCQLMKRCDGHVGDVKVVGEMRYLSESVTVIRVV